MSSQRRNPGETLSGADFARALRALVDGPVSWRELGATANVQRQSAQAMAHGLHRQGLAHIARWDRVPVGRRVQWTAVYAFGPGVDAVAPSKQGGSSKVTPALLRAFCDLVKALQLDSWHKRGLADYLGQDVKAVRVSVDALHKLRLVRVDDYLHRAAAGARPPLFTWGPDQKDAPKPRARSATEHHRHHTALRSARRQHAALMHAMVLGVSLDGRRRAGQKVEAVA
jgi:hypothetical protein